MWRVFTIYSSSSIKYCIVNACQNFKTHPIILAVHVVEDTGGLLSAVVVVDGDQGVPGLLDGHDVPQRNVDAGLLCGHLVKIQHYLQNRR